MTTIAAALDTAIVWTMVAALFAGGFAALSLLHVATDKIMPPWYPFAQSRERNIRRNLRIAPIAARAAGVAIAVLVVELLLRLIVTILGG